MAYREVESGFASALNPILGTSLIDIPDSDNADEFSRKEAHNIKEMGYPGSHGSSNCYDDHVILLTGV